MSAELIKDERKYTLPGGLLSPNYFQIGPDGKVIVVDDQLGAMLKYYIEHPDPTVASTEIRISIGLEE